MNNEYLQWWHVLRGQGGSQDLAINLLLPFHQGLLTAADTIFTVCVGLGIVSVIFRILMGEDGEKLKGHIGGAFVAMLLLIPMNVNYDNPGLWHSQQTFDSATTYAQSNESYRMSAGLYGFLVLTNAIEDVMYYGVDQIRQLYVNKEGVAPEGAFAVLEGAGTATIDSPDIMRPLTDYLHVCEHDNQAADAVPADVQRFFLFKGGAWDATQFYNVADMTPDLRADMQTGLAALAKLPPNQTPQTPPINTSGYVIPSYENWYNRINGTSGTDPNKLYDAPANSDLVTYGPGSLAQSMPATAGVGPSTLPTGPTGQPLWYAHTCADMFNIVRNSLMNYYHAIGGTYMVANELCAPGDPSQGMCVGKSSPPSVTQGTFSTMNSAMKALMFQASQYNSEAHPSHDVSLENGEQASGGDQAVSSLLSGFTWISNFVKKYLALPMILSGAVGAVAVFNAMMVVLFPLVVAFAAIPGRSRSLVIWASAFIAAKLTLFIMYIFLLCGGLLCWLLIDSGVNAGGGGYAALAFSLEATILTGVFYIAPKVAKMLVFQTVQGFEQHHGGEHFWKSFTEGFVAFKTARSIGKLVTSPVKKQIAAGAAARRDAALGSRIAGAVKSGVERAVSPAGMVRIWESARKAAEEKGQFHQEQGEERLAKTLDAARGRLAEAQKTAELQKGLPDPHGKRPGGNSDTLGNSGSGPSQAEDDPVGQQNAEWAAMQAMTLQIQEARDKRTDKPEPPGGVIIEPPKDI